MWTRKWTDCVNMSWNIPENVFYGGELKSFPIVSTFSGSVGKNLANKPNVYVSSSAGARWREVRVSLVVQSTPHVKIMITGCWFSHFTAPLSLWICVTRLLGVLRKIWISSEPVSWWSALCWRHMAKIQMARVCASWMSGIRLVCLRTCFPVLCFYRH